MANQSVADRFREIMTARKFLAWLHTKPATETFNYGSGYTCAVAQYLTACNLTFDRVGGHTVNVIQPGQTYALNIPYEITEPMGQLLCKPGCVRTFGQLAIAVQAHLNEAKADARP